MYIANRPLLITRDGKDIELKVGDPVPEAPSWPTFKSHINVGNVVWVPDEAALVPNTSPASVAKATKTKPQAASHK